MPYFRHSATSRLLASGLALAVGFPALAMPPRRAGQRRPAQGPGTGLPPGAAPAAPPSAAALPAAADPWTTVSAELRKKARQKAGIEVKALLAGLNLPYDPELLQFARNLFVDPGLAERSERHYHQEYQDFLVGICNLPAARAGGEAHLQNQARAMFELMLHEVAFMNYFATYLDRYQTKIQQELDHPAHEPAPAGAGARMESAETRQAKRLLILQQQYGPLAQAAAGRPWRRWRDQLNGLGGFPLPSELPLADAITVALDHLERLATHPMPDLPVARNGRRTADRASERARAAYRVGTAELERELGREPAAAAAAAREREAAAAEARRQAEREARRQEAHARHLAAAEAQRQRREQEQMTAHDPLRLKEKAELDARHARLQEDRDAEQTRNESLALAAERLERHCHAELERAAVLLEPAAPEPAAEPAATAAVPERKADGRAVLAVVWSPEAAQELEGLPRTVAQEVSDAIQILQTDGIDLGGVRTKYLCAREDGTAICEVRLRGGRSPWRLLYGRKGGTVEILAVLETGAKHRRAFERRLERVRRTPRPGA